MKYVTDVMKKRSNLLSLIALTLFVAGYAPIFEILGKVWLESDEYSHAFLILPVIGYMAWTKRAALVDNPVRYAPLGLLLVAFSTPLFMFALVTNVRTIIALSMLMTLIGAIIYLAGVGAVKELFTPILLLAMLIPVPEQLLIKLTFPLQIIVSRISEVLIRDGRRTDIQRRQHHDHSAEDLRGGGGLQRPAFNDCLADHECDHGVFFIKKAYIKIGIGCRQRAYSDICQYHSRGNHDPHISFFSVGFHRRDHTHGFRTGYFRYRPIDIILNTESIGTVGNKIEIKLIVLSFFFLITCIFVYGFNQPSEIKAKPPLSVYFNHIDGYENLGFVNMLPNHVSMLQLDDYVFANYKGHGNKINLYIGYYYSADKAYRAHSPLVCYPAQGWKVDSKPIIATLEVGPYTINYEEIVTSLGQEKELVSTGINPICSPTRRFTKTKSIWVTTSWSTMTSSMPSCAWLCLLAIHPMKRLKNQLSILSMLFIRSLSSSLKPRKRAE